MSHRDGMTSRLLIEDNRLSYLNPEAEMLLDDLTRPSLLCTIARVPERVSEGDLNTARQLFANAPLMSRAFARCVLSIAVVGLVASLATMLVTHQNSFAFFAVISVMLFIGSRSSLRERNRRELWSAFVAPRWQGVEYVSSHGAYDAWRETLRRANLGDFPTYATLDDLPEPQRSAWLDAYLTLSLHNLVVSYVEPSDHDTLAYAEYAARHALLDAYMAR